MTSYYEPVVWSVFCVFWDASCLGILSTTTGMASPDTGTNGITQVSGRILRRQINAAAALCCTVVVARPYLCLIDSNIHATSLISIC